MSSATPRPLDRTAARARTLGADVSPGDLRRPFPCLLGGDHLGRLHPKGRFWHYRCSCGLRSWELSEVRAFRGYGHPGNLSELERTRWRERLDYEAGLLQRGPAQIPLPPRASEATLRVGRGWQLLVGLRDPEIWPADEPFVYARRFVMAWAEVTNQEARRGVEQLEEFGSMVRVGRHPSGPILWRPGPTFALVHGSVEAGEHAAIEAVKAAFVAEELDA